MWSRPSVEIRETEAPIQFRRANDEFEEMDLTPMVDVTFLLLIFFMITASFTLEKTIPTPVPDPNDQSAAQPIQQQDDLLEKSIMIGINADNTITIDEEPLLDASLLRDRLTDRMLREKKAEALVTVADLAMQETVVYVLDTANDVGMQKIRLAAAPGGVN
jgi:biopolymer transport protein ExbD